MPLLSLTLGIQISCLFETISITGIASFYPIIASSMGIPTWLIGIIFSFCPFSSLILSPFVPAMLQKLGRRTVLLLGLLLLGLGNILIGFIVFTPLPFAIFLSFLGRALVGTGYACSLITTYTILTSEYPDKAAKMVATIEILAGIGLTIGPTLGSVFFGFFGYFFACLSIGMLNLIMVPLLYLGLGKLRPYNESKQESYSMIQLLKKPYIALDFMVQILVMFGAGYLMPTTGFHLISYGIKDYQVGYFYSISTFAYFLSSFLVSLLPKTLRMTRMMLLGILIMACGFLFIGPSPYIFSRSLVLVSLGLFVVGFGGGLMYVPSLPHMIEVSCRDYGYEEDDRLNDTLSGLTNMSLCIGEIIGPAFSSLFYALIGYSASADLVTILSLCIFVIFGVFSDAFKKLEKKSTMGKELETENPRESGSFLLEN